MKRSVSRLPLIVETDNLYMAWLKARKGKQRDRAVIDYEKNLDKNLLQLKKELITGNVVTGSYHFFTITDPKVRRICAAPFSQRIMHHAIMNICHNRFEKHLIFNTYATRKFKGTYAALDKARQQAKKYTWFVKLDIRKYFDSIDHGVLAGQLEELFSDSMLLSVLQQIIESYHVEPNKGLPIGNLTSQYFANHYLSVADHYATEQLQIKGYIRYMDDILFFGDEKELLTAQSKALINFVEKTLNLVFKQNVIDRTMGGVPFLGYKLFPYFVRLNTRSKKRFKMKMKAAFNNLKHDVWSESDFQQHVTPLPAFVEKADTQRLRHNVLRKYEG